MKTRLLIILLIALPSYGIFFSLAYGYHNSLVYESGLYMFNWFVEHIIYSKMSYDYFEYSLKVYSTEEMNSIAMILRIYANLLFWVPTAFAVYGFNHMIQTIKTSAPKNLKNQSKSM